MELKNLSYTTALSVASASGLAFGISPATADELDGVSASTNSHNMEAMTGVSGYVQLYGALGSFDYFGDDIDLHAFGGAGRLNWWVGDYWSVQLDARGQTNGHDVNGFNFSLTSFGGAVHVAHRMPHSYALGGLMSLGSQSSIITDGSDWFNVAAQGQIYLGNFTLYGQAGWATNFNAKYNDSDVGHVFAQARYFANDNLMFTGDLSYFDASSNIIDFDGIKWGLGAEFKPATMPASFFARYQGSDTNFAGVSGDATTHEFLAGFKLFVNQDTLLSNDRYGATFLDANPVFGEFNTKFLN